MKPALDVRRLAIMAMLVAIAVLGSLFVSIPIGIAKVFPVQHAINVVAAVTLGPLPAVLIAFGAGLVRFLTGTGSLLAFPGGMIGAVLAGWAYKRTQSKWAAAAGELIGTGLLASLVAIPYANLLMGTSYGAFFFLPGFFLSSFTGALLAVIILSRLPVLERRGLPPR